MKKIYNYIFTIYLQKKNKKDEKLKIKKKTLLKLKS